MAASRLAVADRLNPGPHDLGHEGRRVKDEPQQQGHELGAHGQAAFEIEPGKLGTSMVRAAPPTSQTAEAGR